MLFGKNLRRRHQRGLVAILHRGKHRNQGDNGLAATDVALQQTIHRGVRLHVFENFFDYPSLSIG